MKLKLNIRQNDPILRSKSTHPCMHRIIVKYQRDIFPRFARLFLYTSVKFSLGSQPTSTKTKTDRNCFLLLLNNSHQARTYGSIHRGTNYRLVLFVPRRFSLLNNEQLSTICRHMSFLEELRMLAALDGKK